MPNRWQAIIWTNADLIHWHIYVALGGDELVGQGLSVLEVDIHERLLLWMVDKLYFGEICCAIPFVTEPTTLKRKCRHFDEIFITGCTGSCHFDNFQCSQWWKFHQNEDISVSVNDLLSTSCLNSLSAFSSTRSQKSWEKIICRSRLKCK